MVFKSFSKINLSLNVNKRLNNGLHQIQSHFCLIDLFDEIKIKKNRISKDEIKFIGKAKVSDIDGTIRLVTMDKFNVPVEIEVPSITELE